MAVDDFLSVHPTQAVFTSGLDLATIAAGRVVEARVVSLAESQAVLTGRFGTLQVDLGAAKAAVGDVLRFEVQAVPGGDGKSGLTLSLLGRAESSTAVAGGAVPVDTPARALADAVGKAAARQSGLAPLFASLAGLAAAPQTEVPGQVRALVTQLLNGRLGADGAPTAAAVARGFQGSGLFLESRLATTTSVAPSEDLKAGLKALGDALTRWLGATTGTGAAGAASTGGAGNAGAASPTIAGMPSTGAGPGATPSVASGAAATGSASGAGPTGSTATGAVASGGGTNVGAEPAGATGTSGPATPGGRVAAQAYGAGIRTDREVSGSTDQSPRAAMAAYGASRADASSAPVATVSGGAVASSPTVETSTGLPAAPQTTGTTVAVETATVAAPTATATVVAGATGVSVTTAPGEIVPGTVAVPTSAVAQMALDAGEDSGVLAATVAQVGERGRVDRSSRPPPPRRGSMPRGQAALPPDTAETSGDGIEALARRALTRVDGALQRILLEQYATLDGRDGAAAGTSASARHGEWTAEIPIATSTGTGVMQMTVERDGGGRGGATAQGGRGDWRVRFALDVEPVGPVTAQIGLSGEHLSIGLWVERPEMALRLAGAIGELRGSLEAAAIPVEAVRVAAGRPPEGPSPPASGRFIDVSL